MVSNKTPEELVEQALRLELPPRDRPPFETTVRHLIIAKAVKEYLDTGETPNLVHRTSVKKYVLEWCKYVRYHPFRRVASYVPAEVNGKVRHTLHTMPRPKSLKAAVEHLERVAASHCRSVVSRNPSLGKTLK